MKKTILFFHGFLGNHDCAKSRLAREICSEYDLTLETIPIAYDASEFDKATNLRRYFIERNVVGVVGIFFGGLYARWLNDNFNIPALVINSRYEGFSEIIKPGEYKKYDGSGTVIITSDFAETIPTIEESLDHDDLEFLEIYLSENDDRVLLSDHLEKYLRVEPFHTHVLSGESHGITVESFERIFRQWIEDHRRIIF